MVTPRGVEAHIRRLKIGTTVMAVADWLTVITGTWIVYPWYRDAAPTSPKSRLLANESTAAWHEFAMEWKEHIGWISPIMATVVTFIVFSYGSNLNRHERVRRTAITLFVLAFGFAAVAGLFGALITKAAPVA
jgi:lipopolysaccharide export LptBFGC system permease protein LptF